MADRREALMAALEPVLAALDGLDLADPAAAETLAGRLPLDGRVLAEVRKLVAEGIEAGWLTPREANGVRFGRLARPGPATRGFSIDAVWMDGPGPLHTHPEGEVDLCFALEGEPTFDGHPEGWVVLPPGSRHVPTVDGGAMGILYFLPQGSIVFHGP